PVIRYPLYADKLYSISGDLYLQGSNYGSRIINSILNWDIAFEWGNHAQAGYSTHEDSTNAATAVLSTRTITIDEMTGSLSSNLMFNTGYGPRISGLESRTNDLNSAVSHILDTNTNPHHVTATQIGAATPEDATNAATSVVSFWVPTWWSTESALFVPYNGATKTLNLGNNDFVTSNNVHVGNDLFVDGHAEIDGRINLLGTGRYIDGIAALTSLQLSELPTSTLAVPGATLYTVSRNSVDESIFTSDSHLTQATNQIYSDFSEEILARIDGDLKGSNFVIETAGSLVPNARTITIDNSSGSLSSNLIFNTGYESRISALENAPESGGTIASVYSPISNVATGTTVSVTVSSTQQIYSVVTDSRILLFTNNLSSVILNGSSNINWDVWINFRTWASIGGEELYMDDAVPYVVPSVGWATNIRWADDTPEISTTGCYHFAFSTVDGRRIYGRQIFPTPQKWQRLVFHFAPNATYYDGWTGGGWDNPAITNYAKFYDSFPNSQYKVLKFSFWRWANDAQGKYAIAYQTDGQITPTYATNTVIWAEDFGYRNVGYFPHWRSMWHKDRQAIGTHALWEGVALRGNFVMWYLGYSSANVMTRFYFQENSERPMNELEREQYDAGVRLPAGR
ncbi:MAG: hypothetical protein M0R48_11225, partial [Candidatus Omnitrophica bacterium]|nr:hypothetical protein [Candidatus Omnitrophota bacterium]